MNSELVPPHVEKVDQCPILWPRRSHKNTGGILAILALQLALLTQAAVHDSVTVDEAGHLAAGCSHWLSGSYAAYRVNPPLPRMLVTLPVLLLQPKGEPGGIVYDEQRRPEGRMGREFAYRNAERYHQMLVLARAVSSLFAMAGTLLCWFWARELWDDVAGFGAAVLWSLSPTVLAHGHLITPDLPTSVFGAGALFAFWQFLRHNVFSWALLTGLFLGFALLSKFTALLLFPCLLAYAAYGCVTFSLPSMRIAAAFVSAVAVSIVVLNAGYGAMGFGASLENHPFESHLLTKPAPGVLHNGEPSRENRFRNSLLGRIPIPVPSEYVLGIDIQQQDFEVRLLSYLHGELRSRGWWYYYIYAFAIKERVPFLLLLAIALVSQPFSMNSWFRRGNFVLLTPAAVFVGIVSTQTGFNHHLRYLLPAYPFLVVFASSAVSRLYYASKLCAGSLMSRASRTRVLLNRALLGALAGWLLWTSVRYAPYHLSYFNELVGGPENGHLYLANSNIDWGQDLFELNKWIKQHPEATPLYIAYQNHVDPAIWGMSQIPPPFGPIPVTHKDPAELGPVPGYHAVSVNFVLGFYFRIPLRMGHTLFVPDRAYLYFSRFQPIDRAGYSILIYHISPEDANRVRKDLGLPLVKE